MKKIYKYHAISILIYVLGLLICLLAMFSFKYFFNYQIPTIVFAVVLVVICPLLSATARIIVWINREKVLPKAELENKGINIYLLSIPVEILFALLSITMLLN